MKKRTLLYSLGILVLTGSLVLGGCKKKKEFNEENGQASTDNRTAQSENDNAMNDANDVISNQNLLKGKGASTQGVQSILGTTICGLSLDTTGMATQGTVLLKYDGTVCSNRKREGSIRLTIQDYSTGIRWKNQNCVLKVEFLSYKVTRASDGKSVKLDGVQYVKNETGGGWWELIVMGQSSIASSVTGTNLNVTFEDGKTAVYNINRRITYTFPSNNLTCKAEGIGSSDGLSNLENYGTTRDGDSFTSQVVTPIVWNMTCGWFAPLQGEVDVKVKDRDFTLKGTFGVDNGGNPVTVGSNACPYGWKIEWTYKSKTNKKIFGYL